MLKQVAKGLLHRKRCRRVFRDDDVADAIGCQHIADAIEDKNTTRERDLRLIMLMELVLIRELGGSIIYTIDRLEGEPQENLSQLPEIVRV